MQKHFFSSIALNSKKVSGEWFWKIFLEQFPIYSSCLLNTTELFLLHDGTVPVAWRKTILSSLASFLSANSLDSLIISIGALGYMAALTRCWSQVILTNQASRSPRAQTLNRPPFNGSSKLPHFLKKVSEGFLHFQTFVSLFQLLGTHSKYCSCWAQAVCSCQSSACFRTHWGKNLYGLQKVLISDFVQLFSAVQYSPTVQWCCPAFRKMCGNFQVSEILR